jgi:hypothetical protein
MSIWGQAVPAGTVPTVESPPCTRGREVMDGNRAREAASRARRAVNSPRRRDTASRDREIVRYVRFAVIASRTAIQPANKIQVHDQDDRAFARTEGCGP